LKPTRSHITLLPIYGIGLFIILYIIATLLYPGGSDVDKLAKGFSWLNNYWCELMASQAQNGDVNTARPVAITAMAVLCATMGLFWYNTSFLFKPGTISRQIIRYAGILSVMTIIFLLTRQHDTVINISGTLGLVALSGTLIGLYKNNMKFLVFYGIVLLLLVGANNYIYYTGNFFYILPVIQKITFLLFLLWFGIVTIRLYKESFHL
jgi:hypothetical protein